MRLRYIEGIPGKLDLQVWTDLSSIEQFTLSVISGQLETPGVLVDDTTNQVELVGYDGLYYRAEGWAVVLLSNAHIHAGGTNKTAMLHEVARFNSRSAKLGTHERTLLMGARKDVSCWKCRSAIADTGPLQVAWVDANEGPFAIYHDRCKHQAPFNAHLVLHKNDTNDVIGRCIQCGSLIKRDDDWINPNRAMGHTSIYHEHCL